MNPPFGECSQSIEKHMRQKWQALANDIYLLFVLVCTSRLSDKGFLGAITSRGFMIGRDQRDFRPLLLGDGSSYLDILFDLGLDVLETAAVETCAYIMRQGSLSPPDHTILFVDCRSVERSSLDRILDLIPDQPSYRHFPLTMRRNPQSTLMYRATDEEIEAFSSGELLDPAFGKVTKGLNSSCDERFIRLIWEVDLADIRRRWQFCTKVPITSGSLRT